MDMNLLRHTYAGSTVNQNAIEAVPQSRCSAESPVGPSESRVQLP